MLEEPELKPPLEDAGEKKSKKRPKGLAICLSGGGYRAALFHLGVLRAMHEAKILARVETVSSVSGGSILSAFLARTKLEFPSVGGLDFPDWKKNVAASFRELMKTDIRTAPILCHALWNWAFPKTRSWHIQHNYEKLVGLHPATGKPIKLGDLPASPNFIFCASDLTFGVNWEFQKDITGSYKADYAPNPDWPISLAVAASACFPPVFGPITIDFSGSVVPESAEHEKLLKRVRLSDGGVYDNFGMEPVFKDHREVFISDGGLPFRHSNSGWPWNRSLRFFFVMMNQVGALRKRQFFSDINDGRFDGAFLGIDEDKAGYSKQLVNEKISRIRTDLDRFSEAESCILENHGYMVAAYVLKKHQASLIPAGVTLDNIPHEKWLNEDSARSALKNSDRKFSLKRLARLT